MADTIWVDELIAKLHGAANGVLEVEFGGQKVSAVLGKEVVEWFKDNRLMLIRIGRETFKGFLMLLHEKKEEQAFNLLLSKFEADDIIARMKMNAAELKQDNDLRDQFIQSLKKFALQVLTGVASKIVIGLLI
jgi:hypothetical protein